MTAVDTASPAAKTTWPRIAQVFAPAGVYLAVRGVGVIVLALMAGANGSGLLSELISWDGTWLLAIAQHGYAGVPEGYVDASGNRTPFTPLGFFPGYPGVVAAASLLTVGNAAAAGLLVSLVAGVAAAYGITRIGELVPGGSRRAGLLLTALFAAAPMGVVLSMAYTEALFCALAAWALVGVLREQWLLAGLCTAAAGLVRPTGSSLIVAVVLAALAAAVAGWRAPWPQQGDRAATTRQESHLAVTQRSERQPWPGVWQPWRRAWRPWLNAWRSRLTGWRTPWPQQGELAATTRQESHLAATRLNAWRPWVGGLLSVTGFVGYLAYVATRTGQIDGWVRIQREGWGWFFDGGSATVAYTAAVLTSGERIFDVLIVLTLVGSIVLLGLAAAQRMPWPLLVYGALVLVTTWGTNGLFYAKLRLLVPAFVLLLPLALGLARRRTGTAVAVVVAAALASAWFGGYALTIWRYAI